MTAEPSLEWDSHGTGVVHHSGCGKLGPPSDRHFPEFADIAAG
jgi:hypothetical protein